MKAWSIAGAAVLGLGAFAGAAGIASRAEAQAQPAPVWLNSYEAAQAAAKQSGKPIFLVFR